MVYASFANVFLKPSKNKHDLTLPDIAQSDVGFYVAVEFGEKREVIGYGVAEVPTDYHCMAKSGSLLKATWATTGKDLIFGLSDC